MRDFALTYPQLMNQALRRGFDEPSLKHLRNAHELALKLFDGFYRAQGVPFICHLVRTASIVLAESKPPETVAAALLHSAYMFGAPVSRRAQLKQKMGEAVEALVSTYTEFPWRSENAVQAHSEKLSSYSIKNKQVLAIRLANELEDHLDDAMVYRGAFPYRKWIETRGKTIVGLARRMKMKELAQELEQGFKTTLARSLPEVIKHHCRDAHELPEHRRRRLGVTGRIRSRIKQWIPLKKSA
jgi:(p)ppGpp synthase/HD superfamily hydrolase